MAVARGSARRARQGFRALPMMRPGFTGGTLDRADHLRQDADGVARARVDLRARLLVLNGAEPEVDEAGLLGWTSLADAPDRAELILLGPHEGRTRFAAPVPGTRVPPQRLTRTASGTGRGALYAISPVVRVYYKK